MSTSPRQIRDLSVGLALSALATATAVHGRVIYVDASAPAGGNGVSWQTAFRDLQNALDAGNAETPLRSVEIRVSQGLYTPGRGTLDRTKAFVVTSGVNLMGGFMGLVGGVNADHRDPGQFVSVLSGDLAGNDGPNFTNYSDNSYTIIDGSNTSLTEIDGFDITGGNADPTSLAGPKGVVTSLAINPTGSTRLGRINYISNCRIYGNRATAGSVVYLTTALLRSSEIRGNMTVNQPIVTGGGCFFTSCRVVGNRASGNSSAAVFLINGPAQASLTRFTQCLIANNASDGWGPLRCTGPGSVQVFGCTIANNTSVSGEPIWHAGGTLKLRNSIIAGNRYNSTPPSPLQIAALNPVAFDVDISFLIDNGAAGVRFVSSPATPGPYLSGDPKFASPAGPDGNPLTWQDNDYRLRSGSVAIDRANATDPIFAPGFTDLDGMPLFDDPGTINSGFGAVTYGDLGCFEYQRIITGDFDASGTTNIADVFAFLTAWFAGNPMADVDGNGIGVSDIFAFLTVWFASM